MPTVKSKSPNDVAYRIKGKTWCISRGDRVIENVEWIDPSVAGES